MYPWVIEISSVLPRKSSAIFGNFRKCSETIVWPSEIFGKCSEIFVKSSKRSLLICSYNKQNNTWMLLDMEFLIRVQLDDSRSSLVRYQVEHKKRNSISRRTHVYPGYQRFFLARRKKNLWHAG